MCRSRKIGFSLSDGAWVGAHQRQSRHSILFDFYHKFLFALAVPSNNALVPLRSPIAVRSFLSALAGSSWEVRGGMTEKHRVLLRCALGKFSQEQAVIGSDASRRSRKFNDFSV
jgi:hypothetical protein